MKFTELMVRLTGRVPMLPNPDPDAPAGLKQSASTVIALLKWGSLIAGLPALDDADGKTTGVPRPPRW